MNGGCNLKIDSIFTELEKMMKQHFLTDGILSKKQRQVEKKMEGYNIVGKQNLLSNRNKEGGICERKNFED